MKTKTYMSNKWQAVEKVDHTPDFDTVYHSHNGIALVIMLALVGILVLALVNVDVLRSLVSSIGI